MEQFPQLPTIFSGFYALRPWTVFYLFTYLFGAIFQDLREIVMSSMLMFRFIHSVSLPFTGFLFQQLQTCSHSAQLIIAQFIYVECLLYNKQFLTDLRLISSVSNADDCPLHPEILDQKSVYLYHLSRIYQKSFVFIPKLIYSS